MKIYSPAVRKLAAEAASRACAAVAAERARAEQFSAASPIGRVGLLLGGYGGAEQFSGAFNESDHPRTDDGKFGQKSGGAKRTIGKRPAVLGQVHPKLQSVWDGVDDSAKAKINRILDEGVEQSELVQMLGVHPVMQTQAWWNGVAKGDEASTVRRLRLQHLKRHGRKAVESGAYE